MSARFLPVLAFLIHGLNAQTCLRLSTAAVAPGGAVSLELSLDSPVDLRPAALQWSFQFPSSSISTFTVDDGVAVTAAAKTVICAPNEAGYTCLAVGANAKTIANGVIAKVTAVLAPQTTNVAVQVVNPYAASENGYFIPISAQSGIITTANVSPDRRLRPPLKRIAASQCRPTQ